jgi:chromosome partitioning protein
VKQPNVFSFCNQKGGVGKTTSAINIAAGLAQEGHETLIIDIDPQANATSGLGEEKTTELPPIYQLMLGTTPPEAAIKRTKIANLSLISSNSELSGLEIELIQLPEREFRLRKALEKIRENFSFIFIDCPPSLGLITLNAITSSDYVFIPIQCEYYALEGLGQLLQTYSLVKKNLNPKLEIGAVLLTMADFRTNLTNQVIDEVRKYFQSNVFDTVIPRSVKLSEAPSFGEPGILYDKSSKGSTAYSQVVKEFLKKFPRERAASLKDQEREIKEPGSEMVRKI